MSSWKWSDSGRFAHYSKLAYPYGWARRSTSYPLAFDSSLGFPGEGPLSIWVFLLAFGFLVLFDFPRWTFPVSFALSTSRAVSLTVLPLVSAMPHADHQGSLQPRDRGDVRRAADRSGLLLVDGRPVQPRTRDNREVLLNAFDTWRRSSGDSLSGIIDVAEPDVDKVNRLLENYGRELFKAGRPYNHYAETLNAISSRRPRLRRSLQQSWNLAVAWLREEPGSHHDVALPWQCLLALVCTAWCWGWIQVAGILALSWGGVTRIGEATSAYRKNLLLPSDFGWTIGYVLLQIAEPKTRFKSARHQVARVDQPQLVHVIELAFRNFSTSDPLWPFSGQTLRGRFDRLLKAVRLSGPLGGGRGLDLGSLRAGGATWLLQASENSELVRRRGRWLNSRTIEIYIQETSALQFLPSLDQKTRKLILLAVTIFPKVLAQFLSFDRQGIPSNAWHLLLVE